MGSDIHIYYEVFNTETNAWEHIDYIDKHRDVDGGLKYDALWHDHLYAGDRNYVLFAKLANVRNGYGFAGIKTHEPIQPISEPRGLPIDVSLSVKNVSDDWGVDAHSHSYFTLRELLDANWHDTLDRTGVVTAQEYANIIAGNLPQNWSGDVFGRNVKMVSNDKMRELLSLHKVGDKELESVYTRVEWTELAKQRAFKHFLEETIPAMSELDNNPEHVRMVFWFDN